MNDKDSGIDFDRQVFVHTKPVAARPNLPIAGILFAVAIVAAIGFVVFRLIPQLGRSSDSMSGSDQALIDVEQRLVRIEQRLERVEATRRTTVLPTIEKPSQSSDSAGSGQYTHPAYLISPAPAQPGRPASSPTTDPLIAQRLSSGQRGLGALQNDETENHDAWQATTNRLADVAGEVGSQGVQILRSQDELNQLLSRTEMESIPFELKRGSDPTQVGPVSLVLKSADQKEQRYTLCVYLQPSCVQLKDRVLYEVVQFVTTRNTPPSEVVVTKIMKDKLLGYLEVPKYQAKQ